MVVGHRPRLHPSRPARGPGDPSAWRALSLGLSGGPRDPCRRRTRALVEARGRQPPAV